MKAKPKRLTLKRLIALAQEMLKFYLSNSPLRKPRKRKTVTRKLKSRAKKP